MGGSQEALERFEEQTAWPMLVLSLLIVPLLIAPLVVELSPGADTTFFTLDWLIWAAFAVEYGIRLYLAPRKGEFVKHNVIDLVVVVVPFLRPLRVVRSARAIRLLRAARGGAFLMRGLDAIQDVLRHRKLHYTLLIALVVVVAAGLIISELERSAVDSNIKNVADGLWWAVSTITTVGYGDRFPVTAAGKGVAVVLMLVGVGLFGLLAGTLASFFVERGQQEEGSSELQEIGERLARIEQALGLGLEPGPKEGLE
jgi:voltage-gated potassium channel